MIPDINLLPKADKRQSASKNLYILLTIVVLLLVAFFAFQYFKIRGEIAHLRSEEQQVIAERNQLQEELDSMTVNTGSLKQSIEFVETISYPVSPIIDETIRLQTGNSYLREYTFDEKTAEVTMDFETLSDIANYLSRLTGSAYFQDVQVSSVEHFDPSALEEEDDATNFNEIPRYEVVFTLLIDQQYVAAGGVDR
ncbi:hypothetical protein [Ureibacillus thermosphaericus]|uniref:hypothetical protein n=1 Tax=Ureibacillus thermosphaericus TaxID=51173 RepID=UPI0030CA0EE6